MLDNKVFKSLILKNLVIIIDTCFSLYLNTAIHVLHVPYSLEVYHFSERFFEAFYVRVFVEAKC